jgi:DNA-binding transcriptional LysR family regulator
VNETWLLPPPERALGPIYLSAFRASGLDYPRTAVFTTDPAVRISLLATGRFITIVPSSTLSFSKRSDIKVLPIELQHVRVPTGIVTLKHRTLSPVAQLFIENAREVAKPMAKRK